MKYRNFERIWAALDKAGRREFNSVQFGLIQKHTPLPIKNSEREELLACIDNEAAELILARKEPS